ncbi:MAG: hypothetical protein ACP5E8_06720, partial [Thermoplasmata archaeon]
MEYSSGGNHTVDGEKHVIEALSEIKRYAMEFIRRHKGDDARYNILFYGETGEVEIVPESDRSHRPGSEWVGWLEGNELFLSVLGIEYFYGEVD